MSRSAISSRPSATSRMSLPSCCRSCLSAVRAEGSRHAEYVRDLVFRPGLFGALDAVAPLGFGIVKRSIRTLEQRCQRFFGSRARRHAAAYRGVDLIVSDKPATFRERAADPIGADAGCLGTRSRQNHREFLAAHAAKYVIGPQRGGGYLAELSDHGVADGVAVFIIDGLESIEVEHDHRDRCVIAPAPLQNPFGARQESGPVGNTRERVRACCRNAGDLVALLDQRENEYGDAEREDDAFKIDKSEHACKRS